jgi:hypothetical protein
MRSIPEIGSAFAGVFFCATWGKNMAIALLICAKSGCAAYFVPFFGGTLTNMLFLKKNIFLLPVGGGILYADA